VRSFYLGNCLVEPALNRARANGHTVQLEPKIMQVLVRLAESPGEVVKKDELMRSVWANTFVTDDVLTRSISALRKILQDDPRQPKFIETVSKNGYRLIAPVKAAPEAVAATALARPESAPRQLAPRFRWKPGIALLAAASLGLTIWVLQHRKAPISSRVKLVVLPFQSFTNQPEQEAFNDGLTDDLITELAGLDPEHMAVIARTTAMSYKNKSPKISDVARDLGADYVLEGSARRDRNQVRITAQLIQASDQTHIWSRHYDRDLRDVLGLQAAMARAIAEGIRVNLPAPKPPPAPISSEAYLAYLNGRYNWNLRSEPALTNAIAYFRQAVALNPGYAAAYSGLADAYASLGYGGFLAPSESFVVARQAALKALELDPTLAEPHASLAYVHLYYDWDFPAAEEEFRKALRANPRYVQAHD
jgi:TolB-like protein/DNA-binding winged helix-turn-helix (wHTH) protein